jgi:hypothetical protein
MSSGKGNISSARIKIRVSVLSQNIVLCNCNNAFLDFYINHFFLQQPNNACDRYERLCLPAGASYTLALAAWCMFLKTIPEQISGNGFVFLYYRKFAMSSYCNKIAVTCFSSGSLPRSQFWELLFGKR